MSRQTRRVHSGGHVLVIDDEPLIRFHAQRVLQRAGYSVVVAADGQSGLDELVREHGQSHPERSGPAPDGFLQQAASPGVHTATEAAILEPPVLEPRPKESVVKKITQPTSVQPFTRSSTRSLRVALLATVRGGAASSDPTLTGPTLTGPTLTGPTLTGPTLTGPI
jgi:CheY-like chemotaxis protein